MVSVIERSARVEFGRSALEAEVLARESVGWLGGLGLRLPLGVARLGVPVTRSRRHAGALRGEAFVRVVDVLDDTWAWESWGLSGLQRVRVVRWLLEVHRSGGWAGLSEVAAWASLSPGALAARLSGPRGVGVWLPHVGGVDGAVERLGVVGWLLERQLAGEDVDAFLPVAGVTPMAWAGMLAGVVRVRDAVGVPDARLVGSLGWSGLEVAQVRWLLSRSRRAARGLLVPPGAVLPRPPFSAGGDGGGEERVGDDGLLVVLRERFGFSRAGSELYLGFLGDLAQRVGGAGVLGEGELVVFAIDGGEGARAKLDEAKLVPVRLPYFLPSDAELGPKGSCRTRVSGMKFARIERFALAARRQGALFTLPDLAVLLGIHVDAVRHQLAQHPDVVIPTRGRMKDIGRGVTHKTWIVELYLQMHSVSEIVERTHHSYESVEAYLRDFARVMTLADEGMNAVMIRRVIGRSLSLVRGYLELRERYDRSEHHFRLSQLRGVFTQEGVRNAQRGGSRSSLTGPGSTP